MATKKPKAIVSIENEDIIIDILLRLPRKSITRFKLVSKQWLNLLSSPSFTHNYSMNLSLLGFYANQLYKLSFVPVLEETPSLSLISGFDHFMEFSVHFLESSNGLVLYYATSFNLVKGEEKIKEFYFVHNPITDQYVLLPPMPRSQAIINPYLTPNYPDRSFVNGFVFDHSLNSPKLIITEVSRPKRGVVLVNCFSSYDCIWSSKLHKFDHIFDPEVEENFMLYGPSTFLNNKLHWVSYMSHIFAYDVNEGRFTVFKGPVDGHTFGRWPDYRRGVYLGELQQNLVFIRFSYTGELSWDVTLWTLSDYSRGEWTCGYRIVMNNMPENPINKSLWPLVALDRNNTRIMYLNLYNMLYSYNLETGEFRELHGVHNLDLSFLWRVYIPCEIPMSLISIPPEHYFSALFPYNPSIGKNGWNELNDILQILARPVNTWHGSGVQSSLHQMNNGNSSLVDYANLAIGRSNLPAAHPVGQQVANFPEINNNPAAVHQASYPSYMLTGINNPTYTDER